MTKTLSGALACGLLACLLSAPTALAGGNIKEARFAATVSGTFTSQGEVTGADCWRPGPDDTEIPFKGSGQASERATFSSDSVVFDVSRVRGMSLTAGSFRRWRMNVSVTRSGNLLGGGTPVGCRPNDPPQRCGTKRLRPSATLIGQGDTGFAFRWARQFTIDPSLLVEFGDCGLADEAQPAFAVSEIMTKLRATTTDARLWSRGVRTITLTDTARGRAAKGGHSGSWTLNWTLKLRRVG
jgi:hypothetical protein